MKLLRMKIFIFSFLASALFTSANFTSQSEPKTETTVKECIKIICGKKAHFEMFEGADEADIAAQIKEKYNACTWVKVADRRCKKRIESKF